MVAVVVVLPIVLMVLTCLLERFEARTTGLAPRSPARRPARAERTGAAVTSAPAAPALALVPGTDGPDDREPGRREAAVTLDGMLDADTCRLPRAS